MTTGETPLEISLQADGRTRSYLLHLPEQREPANPIPVVLAFHGAGASAASMRAFCGLDEKADASGFAVVYPNGTGRRDDALTWNAGNCCGYAHHYKVDDVGFVAALLDDLAARTPVDLRRVFAAGMSNGAMMCYRLAAELPERFVAIAAVAGPMAMDPPAAADGTLPRPVSILHFHGSDDEFAPFAGGIGLKSLYRKSKFSVDYTIRAWVERNGCPPTPRITQIPDRAGDGTTITAATFGPGREGSEVVLHTITAGGHTWPGRKPSLGYLGHWTQNISANDLMWDFFVEAGKKRLAVSG